MHKAVAKLKQNDCAGKKGVCRTTAATRLCRFFFLKALSPSAPPSTNPLTPTMMAASIMLLCGVLVTWGGRGEVTWRWGAAPRDARPGM